MDSKGHQNNNKTKCWQTDVLFQATENDAKLKQFFHKPIENSPAQKRAILSIFAYEKRQVTAKKGKELPGGER